MSLRTIAELTADELTRLQYSKRLRTGNNVALPTGRKFAVVVFELADGVNQPDDYAALKAAVLAVPGLQDIHLLIDGQMRATLPENTQLWVGVDVNVTIEDLPEE